MSKPICKFIVDVSTLSEEKQKVFAEIFENAVYGKEIILIDDYLKDIKDLSDTDKIESSSEMQSNLEKIHAKVIELSKI